MAGHRLPSCDENRPNTTTVLSSLECAYFLSQLQGGGMEDVWPVTKLLALRNRILASAHILQGVPILVTLGHEACKRDSSFLYFRAMDIWD